MFANGSRVGVWLYVVETTGMQADEDVLLLVSYSSTGSSFTFTGSVDTLDEGDTFVVAEDAIDEDATAVDIVLLCEEVLEVQILVVCGIFCVGCVNSSTGSSFTVTFSTAGGAHVIGEVVVELIFG